MKFRKSDLTVEDFERGRRYGYTSIKTSSINSLVYMYKRNL